MEKSTRLTLIIAAALTLLLAVACNLITREETLSASGQVCFDVDPPTAIVYLDGQEVGTAAEFTPEKGCLKPTQGRHTITVAKEGRISYEKKIYLGSGTDHIKVKLSPAKSGGESN